MSAPMHIWKKPRLAHSGPIRIAVAQIGGDPKVAERLQEAVHGAQPQTNRRIAAIYPNQLERASGIQLAAYDGQPSEMAVYGAARTVGADFVLQGEVMSYQLELEPPDPSQSRWFGLIRPPEPNENISVRWTIIDVATGQRVFDETRTIDRKEAEADYADLQFQGSNDQKVIAAAARQSWAILSPTTKSTDVLIDLPWFSPGSSSVRKGNGYARQGRWELAEREWQEAADRHQWNRAAWRNLSLAAVAREDFQLARDRLKHAQTKMLPGDETRSTLSWIEEKQREFHQSFELQPPRDGWSFPDPPTATAIDQTIDGVPHDLESMPWYTAIPGVPPPGWTWKQWWSQPFVW